MHLNKMQVQGFRNLKKASLEAVNGVNLITGFNASGKTSLLEAIFYLSHVRSFRTHQSREIINNDSQKLLLTAQIQQQDDRSINIGIQRSAQSLQVRVNKTPVPRLSELAMQFPVLAIHPDSYKLITGSPSNRRQYMDWGVFHVEHAFIGHWQRYKKALSQRNAALKSRQENRYCASWDQEIVKAAEKIDDLRKEYFLQMQVQYAELAKLFFKEKQVGIVYKRGWDEAENLADLLRANLNKDRQRGFTSVGAHRADISIDVGGQSAQTGISRGQQKLLVVLMRLAQARSFTELNKGQCVLLFDDLAAELDAKHRDIVLSLLSELKLQLFLTAIDEKDLDIARWSSKKKFHVEQGHLQELI